MTSLEVGELSRLIVMASFQPEILYDSTIYVPKTPQWILSDSRALHKSNLETSFIVTNVKRKYTSEQGKGEEGSKGVRGKHIFS